MTAIRPRRTIPLAGFAAAAALLAMPAAARAADCAGLAQRLALPHARIVLATEVAGGAFQDDTRLPDGEVKVYRSLPAFCRVRGVSSPSADSEIEFEVWLPVSGWTHRLHMVGNGGYSSNLYYAEMAQRLRAGDVAVATNTGHRGKDLSFGIGHPQKIADFAHRAVHGSAVAAKAVTAAYYGHPARYAYFSGCSTGGYQALMEAQRYPDDFDGIIAGAPGNNRSALNMAFLWNYQANHRRGDDQHPLLDAGDLKLINHAVVARCDPLDGVTDGVINDPRICRFDVGELQCAKDQAKGCLSPEQVTAARRIYAGPRDARTGAVIYPGYPFGTEGVMASADDEHPGWTGYWANPDKPDEPQRVDFFRYWVFADPQWNWWSFDWGRDVDTVRARMASTFDASSPDLRRFAARHGKLIMFMGWQDPVGAPPEAIRYARAVRAATPGADALLRLYMVPGMAHCAGGPGATNFSSATRDSVPPVSDAAHDMAVALEDWVEKGAAPRALIATHYAGEKGERRVAFQRPLCPYPQVARYRGGPQAEATSFVCAAPKPVRKG
ncbi:MAG: tannase/feruloyl esterase family alpha/beta hydrolase [Caulobacterales bacterium]|nr:tannase/feruloyl esterase family alpha/beta hydrolase [Caulobacterales bacterium]